MFRFITGCLILLFCAAACRQEKRKPMFPLDDSDSLSICTDTPEATDTVALPAKSPTALYMDSLGLVDIHEADSSLIIRLMYATADNFTGKLLYKDLKEAYLHPQAAQALIKAHQLLKELRPACRFIVYDAARPLSVQQTMWDAVKGTPQYIYVSNPAHGGGLHNYGLAVDISIADSLGQPLPMGAEVDHMGTESHITNEAQLVKSGVITGEELENRLLLRKVMKEAGFRPLPSEWWHFNYRSRNEAMQNYTLIK